MKRLLFILFAGLAFISCNSPEQNSTTGNTEDSITINKDSMGNTRGEKGIGVDNSGGTSSPGTLSDTAKGKNDSLNHTSKKGN